MVLVFPEWMMNLKWALFPTVSRWSTTRIDRTASILSRFNRLRVVDRLDTGVTLLSSSPVVPSSTTRLHPTHRWVCVQGSLHSSLCLSFFSIIIVIHIFLACSNIVSLAWPARWDSFRGMYIRLPFTELKFIESVPDSLYLTGMDSKPTLYPGEPSTWNCIYHEGVEGVDLYVGVLHLTIPWC